MRRLGTLLALVPVLLGASVTSTTPPASAANATWSVVPSPNRVGAVANDLRGVSCVSASSCTAVGFHLNGGYNQTLIESWNGKAWSVVPSPNAGPRTDNYLYGVSCVSASSCTAVGTYDINLGNPGPEQTLIESWNGARWTIVPSPNVGSGMDNYLLGVSCVSVNSCTAVGYYDNGSTYQTLIESRSTAIGWSVVPSPSPGNSSYLSGVSCVSPSLCTAAGSYSHGTLIESWNGSAWSVVPSPNPGTGDRLDGVYCVSATFCTAVGNYGNGSNIVTLVETWDGSTWSVVPSPNGSQTQWNLLLGVSCTSANSCMAVGYYFVHPNEQTQTLIESWDGSTWSIAPSPDPRVWTNELRGVSCISATFCTASGDASDIPSADRTLIESWDGSAWSVVASVDLTGTVDNDLRGVSCVSGSSCTAVGSYNNGIGYQQTLIESRTGAAGWTIVSSPNAGSGTNNYLYGVSCVSASFCTAVGHYDTNGINRQTLIESWDGSAWSIVPSPNAGTDNFLDGVSCISASSCTAVGFYFAVSPRGQTFVRTLIESWNGTAWSVVPSPNPPPGTQAQLEGVSCVSVSFCTAVGTYPGSNGSGATLIETWNGSAWSVVPSPSGRFGSQLTGVSCVSATSCTAAGFCCPGGDRTLIESWNGSAWSVVSSPNRGSYDYLDGVSCVSGNSCTAVGYYDTGSTPETLIETWDGLAWSIVPSPNRGTVSNEVFGVSCVSTTSCTAAGFYSNGGVVQTLIEASS